MYTRSGLQRSFFLTALASGLVLPGASAATLFVNAAATSQNPDGHSWQTAFSTIQAAANAAASGDEIWVARGVYPGTLLLQRRASLYGGFAGTETARTERTPTRNRTVLDGGGSIPMTVDALGSTPFTIDGFTVANSRSGPGIDILNGIYLALSNMTVRGCGVGINNLAAASAVSNSLFVANDRAVVSIGGNVINNVFFGNGEGVSVFPKGALVVNNTFVWNHLAIQANGSLSTNPCTVSSNIFLKNGTAVDQLVSTAHPAANCTFSNGVNYVGIADPVGTAGNIEADPLLTEPDVGEFHLQSGSPCIDTGTTASGSVPAADMDGQARVVGARPDIGADEFDGTIWTAEPAVVRVSPTGDDANDGAAWATAKRTLPSAIEALWGRGGEVWVAAGLNVEPAAVDIPIHLYGRFAGTESERSQRSGGPSILRGDETTEALTLRAVSDGTIVDGFVLRDSLSGILCADGSPTISNCFIAGNTEGVTIEAGAPVLLNDTLLGNARGVAVLGGAAAVTNSLLAYNDTGVFVDAPSGAAASIHTSCVYGPVRFEGMADPGLADGNISADPMLAAPGMLDVHLQPGSPCIDAGSDEAVAGLGSDMDGQARIQGAHADIGADEADGISRTVAPGVLYVSLQGNDANDGSSWATAKRTFQAGIDAASLKGHEVWVAAGTYSEPVLLRPFTYAYGGFAGTEMDRQDRNVQANPATVTWASPGSAVRITSGHTFNVLDGFTVRDSDTGILLTASSALVAGITLTRNNIALESTDGSPTVSRNRVLANFEGLDFSGGAPVVQANTISAQSHRGIAVWSSSATIRDNAVTGSGDTGLYIVDSTATVNNNTVIGHPVGLWVTGGAVTAANNIVAYNTTGVSASAGATPALAASCLFGNRADFAGMVSPPEGANIFTDPRLASPLTGDIHIQPDSPCRDAGDPSAEAGDEDMDGQPRVLNGRVDIGADESDGSTVSVTPRIIHVRPDGDDAGDGFSWSSAKRTVQAGIDASAPGGEVWVATGTYPESVRVRPFTSLFGGFAGTETDRTARDVIAHPTTLAGAAPVATVRLRGGHTFGLLDGFTVQAANLGISSNRGAPTISDNTVQVTNGSGLYDLSGYGLIVGNHMSYTGDNASGILAEDSGALMNGNSVTCLSITAPLTSGIYALRGAPTIASNLVAGSYFGIHAEDSQPIILNNTAYGNQLGLFGLRSASTVVNNIFGWGKTGVVVSGSPGPVVFRHNDVYAFTPYNGFPDPKGADGNISMDPRYRDARNNDYRLRADSPCIEAGDDAFILPGLPDAAGQLRVLGTHVDMGALESPRLSVLADAALALRIAAGLHTATPEELARLDVDPTDPGITLLDAVRIAIQ